MTKITPQYKGRFAPSPTGSVHFGTLIAAVGSYLQAKKNKGEWLLRIEDVDTTRRVEGVDKDIIKTLESFGFEWDGEIIYQSKQTQHYEQALAQLIEQSSVFPCLCTRKQLSIINTEVYPGTCRSRLLPETSEHALRIISQNITLSFTDRVMGQQSENIQQQCGDFIIKRRDGLFAYQLAVVVDDARQGITEIVRGGDLLHSTPRQIYLQKTLGYTTPRYCHLPLAIKANGEKISKSEGAVKVDIKNKKKLLHQALKFLNQQPPNDLIHCHLTDIWKWATENWNVNQVPSKNKRIQI